MWCISYMWEERLYLLRFAPLRTAQLNIMKMKGSQEALCDHCKWWPLVCKVNGFSPMRGRGMWEGGMLSPGTPGAVPPPTYDVLLAS